MTTQLDKESSVKTIDLVAVKLGEDVDWFNNRRLLEPIGNIPPAEAEVNCYAALDQQATAA